MPHVIIEYAPEGLGEEGVPALLERVHGAVAATGLFDEGNIKVRALPVAHYLVAGARRPFIAVQCRIHAGRTVEQRRALSEAVLAVLRERAPEAEVATVEVVEMERGSYAKYAAEVER